MSRARIRLAVVLALSLGTWSNRASADVTVIYAPPPVPPPLVASVVSEPWESPEAPERHAGASAPETSSPRSRPSVASAPAPSPSPAPPSAASSPAPASPALPPPVLPSPALPSPVLPPPVLPSAAPAPPAAVSTLPRIPAPALAPATSLPSRRSPAVVELVRVIDGEREVASVSLVDEAGRPDLRGLEALSVLARPEGMARPSEEDLAAHREDLAWVATDLRRLHPALVLRLAALASAFPGRAIEIVSGTRPEASESSRHRSARALDLRVSGVPLAEVDAFLRTLEDTGVGLHPASDLVHLDVRSGHAHWVDLRP